MKIGMPGREGGRTQLSNDFRRTWGLLRLRLKLFRLPRMTIRAKILTAFLVMLGTLGAINALFLWQAFNIQRQYDRIIDNIATSNELLANFKPAIDTEMWSITAGKMAFDQGEQYRLLDGVTGKIVQLKDTTNSDKGRVKLDVILRTLLTLRFYVDKLGEQMRYDSTFSENEAVLENIRGVSDVVNDGLQEYMLFEVARSASQSQQMRRNFETWAGVNVASLAVAAVFSVLAAWQISAGIYLPIKKLHDTTAEVTREDLNRLIDHDHTDEITELGMSFDIMTSHIKELLDFKLQEQDRLKKYELRTLQAQINPHFLYNTLDTIIWMAQSNQNAKVVELVQALSAFFRISLSKGKDWISVSDEIDHVCAYLAIQKMRYRDILDYHVEVDPAAMDGTVLKLTLQPLVENALYHGVKNKRGGGMITVRGWREGGDLLLEVHDTGIGMDVETLAKIRAALAADEDPGEPAHGGFGIYNVNRRVKLFYGQQYGLEVDSAYGEGTTVRVRLPG